MAEVIEIPAATPRKWAKLLEINGEQVLFFLEPDGDDMRLHQCVQTPGGTHMDMTLVFTNDLKDNSRKAFDMADEDVARRLIKMMHDMLDDAAEDEEAGIIAEAEEDEEE